MDIVQTVDIAQKEYRSYQRLTLYGVVMYLYNIYREYLNTDYKKLSSETAIVYHVDYISYGHILSEVEAVGGARTIQ